MSIRLLASLTAVTLAAGTALVAAQGTGQAPGAEPKSGTSQKGGEPKTGGAQQPQAGEKAAPKGEQKATEKSTTTTTKTTVTTEQRTKIRETIIRQKNAPRVANVNFTISVGTVVPSTVTLVALPGEVVTIYPGWRGFRYFMVGDQIIVVDSSMRIVAVLDA